MPLPPKKYPAFTLIASLALSFLLASCDMPTQPEGMNVGGMTRLGDQLRAGGDDAGAADFYQRALQRNPNDASAHKALGAILEAHGNYDGAEAQYGAAAAANSSDADMLRAHGRMLIKLGRAADARDEYEKALRLSSSDVKALNGLGIALDYLNQHDAAQKAYHEALDDEPGNLVTVNNLAHSYVLAGAYDEAIKLLEPYAQDKNATLALRQNLAEAYGMTGMDTDAERMARMDLPPAQVKRNLDYYRAQRAKIVVTPKLYADLGSFGTEGMAQARSDMVKNSFGEDVAGLVLSTTPEVKTAGGTPIFVVRVTGFANAAKLKAFCDKIKKSDMGCSAVEGG